MSDLSTVRAGESLALGNGVQLALLEVDEIGLPATAYGDQEARGRFTGERLFFSNPSLYRAIVKLLARGQLTYREIAEVCEVSTNTVCGVSFREGIPVETIRERLGRIAFDVGVLSLETLRELLADPELRRKISARDLSIIAGIATEKGQLLMGGATGRLEVTTPAAPTHAAYLEYVRNVTGTGSPRGPADQKEAVSTIIETTPGETTTPASSPSAVGALENPP